MTVIRARREAGEVAKDRAVVVVVVWRRRRWERRKVGRREVRNDILVFLVVVYLFGWRWVGWLVGWLGVELFDV